MRFMIIIQATAESEQGCMPTAALMTAMARYHEELARAGVLLDDIERLIAANSRQPRLVLGDLRSQTGAVRVGAQRMQALAKAASDVQNREEEKSAS